MPTRKLSRKKSTHPTRTARRSAVAPRFSRVRKSLVLSVPPDCEASVIMKQVGHDERRYYAWWLLVGRYDQETMTARYKFTGEDTVRCDIPIGVPLSASALQSHLARFLRGEGTQEDDPPIIIKGKPK